MWLTYGCGSLLAVGVPVDGPTTLQPVVAPAAVSAGPGCGGGYPVARGGPCTVTGVLVAAVGPAKKVPICLSLPSFPLCMHNFISRCTRCRRCRSLVLMCLQLMYNTVGGNAPRIGVPHASQGSPGAHGVCGVLFPRVCSSRPPESWVLCSPIPLCAPLVSVRVCRAALAGSCRPLRALGP